MPAPDIFEPGGRTRRRRRARRRGRVVWIFMVMALVAGGVWAATNWPERRTGSPAARFGGAGDTQTAYLFMIRQADDQSRRSDMLAVFALNKGGRDPVALLIPSGAFTEIPGHGNDLAGRGFSFGGMPLQSLVVDNMLGIKLDLDVAMTDAVLGQMVDDVGGLEIDVSAELIHEEEGSIVPEFAKGTQQMDGEAVRRYLRFQGSGETELSRLARAGQVWEALIARWGRIGPGVLAQKFRALGREYGQGLETGLSPLDMAEFFTSFAAAGADNAVFTTLPVTPVGAGGSEQALRVDEAAVAELVEQYFAGSVPRGAHVGTRVQVLNGSGTPQIGVDVGLRLIPAGFRLISNRNASSFDNEVTKIRIYSREESDMAIARKIQELLGVGQIEIGLSSQTLVDVTVVVGHDFQPRSS